MTRQCDLMRVAEVAQLLGITADTALRWARAGRLPPVATLTDGGWNYFRRTDIEQWTEKHLTKEDEPCKTK
jgi:excisionase family DNA binding protein